MDYFFIVLWFFSKVLKLLHCFQLAYYFCSFQSSIHTFFIARFSFNDKYIASKCSPFLLATIHSQFIFRKEILGHCINECGIHQSIEIIDPWLRILFFFFIQLSAYFYQSIEQKPGEDFYGISHSPYSISLPSTPKIFSKETVKIDNAWGWCRKNHVDQRDIFVFDSRSSYNHCPHLKLFFHDYLSQQCVL